MHARGQHDAQVCVRVRPLTGAERTAAGGRAVRLCGDGELFLHSAKKASSDQTSERRFCFDRTFQHDVKDPCHTTSDDVFAAVGLPAQQQLQHGRDAAVVVYGAPGTGKSHTLFGRGGDDGVALRLAAGLLKRKEDEAEEEQVDVHVTGRVVEVCDERVNDLLQNRSEWHAAGIELLAVSEVGGGSVQHGWSCSRAAQARDLCSVADVQHMLSDAELNRTAQELPGGAERPLGHFVVILTFERRFRARRESEWETSDRCELTAVELAPIPANAELAGSEQDDAAARPPKELDAVGHSLRALASCVRSVRGGRDPDLLQSPLTQLMGKVLLKGRSYFISHVSPSLTKHADTERTLEYTEGLRHPRVQRPTPVSIPHNDTAAWLCGREHTAAVCWMEEAKKGCEYITEGLADVAAVKLNDVVITCFTEARRAYALQVGAAVFDVIDLDGDGQLSSEELAQYLEEFPELRERLANEGTQRLARDWSLLLTMLDTDGSGALDLKEFAEIFCKTGLGVYEDAAAVFKTIDANDNGCVDCSEFRQHLESNPDFHERIAEAKQRQMAASWDKLMGAVRSGIDGGAEPGATPMSPGSRAKFTRDDFAELWANSGLGEAPDGLGIMSSLSPGSAAPQVVPGRRATAARMRLEGKEEADDAPRKWGVASSGLVEGLASPKGQPRPTPGSALQKAQDAAFPVSPPRAPRTPPAGFVQPPKMALPKRPQSASLSGRIRAGDRGRGPGTLHTGESLLLGRRGRASSPHDLSKKLSQSGKVDYGALLKDQQVDLQKRERSMEGYHKMLEEVRKYNEQVMRLIFQNYERVVESKVVSKWRRVSGVDEPYKDRARSESIGTRKAAWKFRSGSGTRADSGGEEGSKSGSRSASRGNATAGFVGLASGAMSSSDMGGLGVGPDPKSFSKQRDSSSREVTPAPRDSEGKECSPSPRPDVTAGFPQTNTFAPYDGQAPPDARAGLPPLRRESEEAKRQQEALRHARLVAA